MGTTSYGLNDALAVKLWSKKLAVEATKALDIAPLFGESAKSVIQVKTETQKGTGDKVTFGLRMQLNGNGFTSSGRPHHPRARRRLFTVVHGSAARGHGRKPRPSG